jgi:putative transposase
VSHGFIEAHRPRYSVRRLCELLKVSPSGYYAWRAQPESDRARANRALLATIKAVFEGSRQTYGYPRVHAELKAQGLGCGRHRVARLMRAAGLKARMTRLWSAARRARTDEHIETNKLNRVFRAPAPNRRWVADITHIPTAQGWLYLSAVMDLYSRRIVGWSMASRPVATLSTEAVAMAIGRRGPV